MPYAILRMNKHKGGASGAIEKHHERDKEAYKSNPDIDVSRSVDNFHIKQPQGKYHLEVQNRIEAAQCRVRKDSVRMIDTLIAATPEFMRALPAEKQRQFFQHAYNFMKEKVGEENIFAAVVHMDEKTPHMHLCFVPLTKDKRLSAKEILGNKAAMHRWQNEFYSHMSARFPTLERGEPTAETQREHQPVQQFKRTTQTPEFIQLWHKHERLRRRWAKVPYPIKEMIVEEERRKRGVKTRGAR